MNILCRECRVREKHQNLAKKGDKAMPVWLVIIWWAQITSVFSRVSSWKSTCIILLVLCPVFLGFFCWPHTCPQDGVEISWVTVTESFLWNTFTGGSCLIRKNKYQVKFFHINQLSDWTVALQKKEMSLSGSIFGQSSTHLSSQCTAVHTCVCVCVCVCV